MKYKKLYFIFFAITFTFCTLNLATTASPSIPTNYNNQLDLNEIYVYNVSAFNTSKALEWRELDWFAPPRGFVNVTPGGQILIDFTGFYDKDPNDFFNLFESPIPYMNIEFKKIHQGSLITNTTFYNISNGEVDMNLLLGYNTFKSGFLIPTNNITYLKQEAYAQDQPPFMNATVIIEENPNNISFDFHQEVGFLQRTKTTYDKVSGLLMYCNTSVGNYTLEMTITNLPDLSTNHIFVPSYIPTITFFTISITSILLILKVRRSRNKQRI